MYIFIACILFFVICLVVIYLQKKTKKKILNEYSNLIKELENEALSSEYCDVHKMSIKNMVKLLNSKKENIYSIITPAGDELSRLRKHIITDLNRMKLHKIYIDKYSIPMANSIITGKPFYGMSKEMLIECLGEPTKKLESTKTLKRGGIVKEEKWTYGLIRGKTNSYIFRNNYLITLSEIK